MMRWCRRVAVLLLSAAIAACSQPDKHQEKMLLSDGSTISLAQLQGKWVFVNYWATWCDYCRGEIQSLNRFAKAYKDKVLVLGYNYDDLHDKALNQAMRKFDVQYAELEYIPSDLLNIPEDVDALPVTFVINPKGEFVNTLHGMKTQRQLVGAMD